jgi:hypothetical protein
MNPIIHALTETGKGRFVVIGAVTAPRTVPGSPAHRKLIKVSRIRFRAGQDYESTVQRAGGETFQAEARSYGSHVAPCLVEHKGHHYAVTVNPETVGKPKFYVMENGKLKALSSTRAKESLAPAAVSEKQVAAGAEKQTIYRNYRVDRISYVAAEGAQTTVRRKLREAAEAALSK